MSRHRRRRAERETEYDDEDEGPLPPRRKGNALLFGGAGLLAAGFVAGYLVGIDGAKRTSAPAAPSAPFAQRQAPFADGGNASMPPNGNLAPAVLPPPHKGHTFTGNVDVPPHSEEAHHLADVLLRDVTCPCGGCDKMTLGTCECDTAKEVSGFAAHLLERGKRGDEVLASLGPRYGLDPSPAVVAQARTLALADPQLGSPAMPEPASAPAAAADGGSSSTLDGLEGLSDMASKPGVQRLVDVPTSARGKGR